MSHFFSESIRWSPIASFPPLWQLAEACAGLEITCPISSSVISMTTAEIFNSLRRFVFWFLLRLPHTRMVDALKDVKKSYHSDTVLERDTLQRLRCQTCLAKRPDEVIVGPYPPTKCGYCDSEWDKPHEMQDRSQHLMRMSLPIPAWAKPLLTNKVGVLWLANLTRFWPLVLDDCLFTKFPLPRTNSQAAIVWSKVEQEACSECSFGVIQANGFCNWHSEVATVRKAFVTAEQTLCGRDRPLLPTVDHGQPK